MTYEQDEHPEKASFGSPLPATKAPPKGQRYKRNRWQSDAVVMEDIFNQCSPCGADHPFLIRNGISQPIGLSFNGEDIAGVPCKGSYVVPIYDQDGNLVSALLKVQAQNGRFEDFFVPNTPLARCRSAVGDKTGVIVVTIDLESALAIHLATGHGVYVALHDGNLMQVCKSLRGKYQDDEIVIAASVQSIECRPLAKKSVIQAAAAINASIAIPGQEDSFADLNVSEGPSTVARYVDQSRYLASEWAAYAGADIKASDPLTWPQPVHAGGLMAAMCAYLSQYTVLPFNAINAIVLWILGTYMSSIFSIAPVLALLSLTRRCGKSVTLMAIASLVHKPEVTSETTAAGLYEMCDKGLTPLLDECDQYFQKRASPTNAIINSGYTKIASTVTRKGATYNTFCFKLIAAIGTLPTTIMDRSIVIPLIRKGTEEKVARYQSKENDQAAVLSAMIRRFVADRAAEIQLIDLTAPDLGNDRAIDNWTPLLAIASCGGDKWLKNAHEAAFELSRGDDEVPVILEEFICDVVAIFIKSKADFIATKDLIAALCAMEDKPWATYGRSHHSITIHDLGKLMREAKVRVGAQKHDQDGNRRGFYRKDVEHLFDGYGPAA